MKRLLLTLVVMAVLGGVPTLAQVGTTGGFVTITQVDVRQDGTFLINLSSNMQNSPSCVTSIDPPILNRVSSDASTAGGKALLEAAMSAFSSGRRVVVDGDGTCTQFTGIESIFRIAMFP